MFTVLEQTGDAVQRRQALERAAAALRDGALVVLPMETVYGVAASAADGAAVDRLRALKSAGAAQAMTVHVPDVASARRWAAQAPAWLGRVLPKLLPGPVTLKLPVEDPASMLSEVGLPSDAADRVWESGVVRLRCPAHADCRAVLAEAAVPIVATGAALPGERLPIEAKEAATALGGRVDYVLDGGRSRHGRPSTVVRIENGSGAQAYHIERPGVLDARYLQKLMRLTVLFVCSGNTCRSPMAEAMARQQFAHREGVSPDQLEARGVRLISAGTFAGSGQPASPEAVDLLRASGIDLSGHRSRPLSRELINEADVIFTMTRGHRDAVLATAPDAAEKTRLLDEESDISDPIGAGAPVYQQTAEQIRQALDRRLKELA